MCYPSDVILTCMCEIVALQSLFHSVVTLSLTSQLLYSPPRTAVNNEYETPALSLASAKGAKDSDVYYGLPDVSKAKPAP